MAPPSPAAMEGVSAAVLHSLSLSVSLSLSFSPVLVLVPLCASFSSAPLMEQSPSGVF